MPPQTEEAGARESRSLTAGHPGPFPLLEVSDEAFIYFDFQLCCSICAPVAWTKDQVETFALTERPRKEGQWQAIDKSRFGGGQPTPNPCDHAPTLRKHWFLMVLKVTNH